MTDDEEWEFKLRVTKGFAILVFLAVWAYCTVVYGFVLGLGLGWIPSLICAGVTSAFMLQYFGFILSMLGLFVVWVIYIITTGA